MRKFWLIIGCTLAVASVAFFGHTKVPLYDGVGFPDEPYRYVNGIPGKSSTLKPSSTTTVVQMFLGGNTSDLNLSTSEQGPQFYLSLGMHSIGASQKAQSVTITATPLAPTGAAIAGDMYRITASSDDGSVVKFNQPTDEPIYLDMRLPQGYPAGAAMLYRSTPTAGWQQLKTSRVGNDIYESNVPGVGDYGLKSVPLTSTSNKIWLLGLPLLVWVLIVARIIMVKRRSNRSKGGIN